MTKRRGILVAIAGVAILGTLVLTGFRGPGFHCRGDMDPEQMQERSSRMLGHMLDRIDATDTQREQIMAIKEGLFTRGMALRDEHMGSRDEMLEIWESDAPDADAVHAKVDARIEALRLFAHEAADSALELHTILTPEQRAQVAERVREHGPRH